MRPEVLAVEDASAETPTQGRKAQRDATRAALLKVAVETLIERGAAGVTTLEVQQRAGVSRGALLHHFHTRADLLSATVTELVRQNEAALWREEARVKPDADPLTTAIRTLATAAATPSYIAEMELWTISRTDQALRDTLRVAERSALRDRERVLEQLFACIRHEPGRQLVIDLTIEFARGHAISGLLRQDRRRHDALVEDWARTARLIIERARDPQPERTPDHGTDDILLAR